MLERWLNGSCIGFAGKIYSGKTTIANTLKNYILTNFPELNLKIDIRSFGDPLRETTSKILGFDIKLYKRNFSQISEDDRGYVIESIYTHCRDNHLVFNFEAFINMLVKAVTFDDLYRISLQYIGTELYRVQVDPEYWVKRFSEYMTDDRLVICDDIRFPQEVKLINTFGTSIYIIPEFDSEDLTNKNDSFDSHASENSITSNDCDLVLVNIIKSRSDDESKEYSKIVGCYVLEMVLETLALKRDALREYGGM